jgi:hypothetical protein
VVRDFARGEKEQNRAFDPQPQAFARGSFLLNLLMTE